MTTRTDAHLEHAIGLAGEFVLRVHTGEVELRGTDGDTVRIRDLDGGDLEEAFQVERAPGRLALRPRDRFSLDLGFARRGRGRVRLAIELPTGAATSVDTASADVTASGLTGEQRHRTASGELRLAGVSGTLGVDAVSGSVDIAAVGSVQLSGRLVSGDLRLRGGRLENVALATTSGDVDLGAPLDGAGPFGIQTVSGDVKVVAGEAGLRVEARTVTGDVAADAPAQGESGRGRRTLQVGAGRSELTFRSISGDLWVASTLPPARTADPHLAEPASETSDPAGAAADPRLAILRELERGAIDVDDATRQLAELDEPRDG